ncbi:hypothetical protein JKP88DRAFT_348557 [Tribonema minus]|uniref:C2H2-type domain-containing protein n=1 Tax=Tribonema minus TaxID=303371 RepID=A0A835Z5Q2_9STRA|nr:hypothetical protein JKP88DRAFT_348557 [Tribonema minus]
MATAPGSEEDEKDDEGEDENYAGSDASGSDADESDASDASAKGRGKGQAKAKGKAKGVRGKGKKPKEDFSWVCPTCGKKFTTKPGMRYHVKKANPTSMHKKKPNPSNTTILSQVEPLPSVSWRTGALFPAALLPWQGPSYSVTDLDTWASKQTPPVQLPSRPLHMSVVHHSPAAGSSTKSDATAAAAAATSTSMTLDAFTGAVHFSGGSPELYFNAGGAVWDMDICAGVDDTSYVAIAIDGPMQADDPRPYNDQGLPGTLVGISSPAPSLLQVWAMQLPQALPLPAAEAATEDGGAVAAPPPVQPAAKATLAYAIAHGGGRGMNVAWAPDPGAYDAAASNGAVAEAAGPCSPQATLGLLAAAFADGLLRIYLCPAVSAVESRSSNNGAGGSSSARRVLEMAPLFTAALPDVLVTCVAWCPYDPTLLLTGLSDGSCSTWHLPPAPPSEPGTTAALEPWLRFVNVAKGPEAGPGSNTMLAVSWSPFERHLFASMGFNEQLCVWDEREPHAPRQMLAPSKARCGTAIAWDPSSGSILFTQMDAPYLHHITMNQGQLHQLWRPMSHPPGAPQHASWSVSTALLPYRRGWWAVAAATPDAEVGLAAYGTAPGHVRPALVCPYNKGYCMRPTVAPVRFTFEAAAAGTAEAAAAAMGEAAATQASPRITCHVSDAITNPAAPLEPHFAARPPLQALVHCVKLWCARTAQQRPPSSAGGEDASEGDDESIAQWPPPPPLPPTWLLCGGAAGLVRCACVNAAIEGALVPGY